MYVDIWDIEIITHAAGGETEEGGEREGEEWDTVLQETPDPRATWTVIV